jgi:hypothetical protein
MAFPIIPKKRSGATGNPSTLQLGELATNTQTGELFLGGDGGVMLLNPPTSAGTTVTEHTGDGTTVAFTFTGYNGTADGGYLVSVGGIDQPPSKYAVTSTAGGTITFVEAPVAGELISIRAIVAGGGGGGSGNATQIQGRDVASDAPTNGQVLAWDAAQNRWEPTSLNGSVTFNSAGTHQWAVPAWVRYAYVDASAGDGSDGGATDGEDGAVGENGYYDPSSPLQNIDATTGANGADGISFAGENGKDIEIGSIAFNLAGGTAGLPGLPGFGGGGSGGGAFYSLETGYAYSASGNSGNPIGGGGGGGGTRATPFVAGGGGAAGGGTATDGGVPTGGTGSELGGNGGDGGSSVSFSGGGGGGGDSRCGGGGGGGGSWAANGPAFEISSPGAPGKGGTADTSMCAGGAGETFTGAMDFSTVAGTTIDIVISEGAGTASITITW